ncbi:universal stress protein [Halorubrum sp. DTA98]|uniref:universal stress protein n=1 Tax=Halorubrum sp. DTA98 TaxID=3402163 RepID=UPI003AAF2E09
MKYLVATDGSDESDDAIRYAATQAAALDATLEIVHVLTPETEVINGEIVLPGDDQSIELGERILQRARRLAVDAAADRDVDLPVDTELLAGRPANVIADHASDIGADAIYVGHRGLSEERERVVGSVAKGVVDRATVPVTVIR